MNRYTETQIIWPMKEAMKLALDALEKLRECDLALTTEAIAALRQAISEAEQERLKTYHDWYKQGQFDASIEQAEQEHIANAGKPIQPASQEYQDHLVNQSFDWSAMAAKHQFMKGYRIGLAEMREKCAQVCKEGTGEAVQKAALEIIHQERERISAAIRAIKFEGDTGFRPVSEMIAEHKQDPKKGAAIEKAKMRKATRAEKIVRSGVYEVAAEQEPSIDFDRLHELGWQYVNCPACGSDMAQAYSPKAEQEPVDYATREYVYREIDRSVNRIREQMKIKDVAMRCSGYDLALPIIDIYEGHVLVGQVTAPPQREWVSLTDDDIKKSWNRKREVFSFARAIEAKLKEKNK